LPQILPKTPRWGLTFAGQPPMHHQRATENEKQMAYFLGVDSGGTYTG
jgi:hypothetical protein